MRSPSKLCLFKLAACVAAALIAVALPGNAQTCKAALDPASSAGTLASQNLTTFEPGTSTLSYCGTTQSSNTAYVLTFPIIPVTHTSPPCLNPFVFTSPDPDLTMVGVNLHFVRDRKKPNESKKLHIYLKDEDLDSYQATVTLPSLPLPTGCSATIDLGFYVNGSQVVSQSGKRPVGNVSVGTVRLLP